MADEFENVIKVIGTIVTSLIIVALPILCGLSYGFNWDVGYRFVLTMFTIGECAILWAAMWGSLN